MDNLHVKASTNKGIFQKKDIYFYSDHFEFNKKEFNYKNITLSRIIDYGKFNLIITGKELGISGLIINGLDYDTMQHIYNLVNSYRLGINENIFEYTPYKKFIDFEFKSNRKEINKKIFHFDEKPPTSAYGVTEYYNINETTFTLDYNHDGNLEAAAINCDVNIKIDNKVISFKVDNMLEQLKSITDDVNINDLGDDEVFYYSKKLGISLFYKDNNFVCLILNDEKTMNELL